MGDAGDFVDKVEGPESFLEFVRRLRADRLSDTRGKVDESGCGPNGWYNHTIEGFLEAAIAWAEDTELGATQGLESTNVWRRCAVFLYCGKIYE